MASLIGNDLEEELQNFWPHRMAEISILDNKTRLLHWTAFPSKRIKTIMRTEFKVSLIKFVIGVESSILLSKAAEFFIMDLTLRGWIRAEINRRVTLQWSDINEAVTASDANHFDFLVDILHKDELEANEHPLPIVRSSVNQDISQYSQGQKKTFLDRTMDSVTEESMFSKSNLDNTMNTVTEESMFSKSNVDDTINTVNEESMFSKSNLDNSMNTITEESMFSSIDLDNTTNTSFGVQSVSQTSTMPSMKRMNFYKNNSNNGYPSSIDCKIIPIDTIQKTFAQSKILLSDGKFRTSLNVVSKEQNQSSNNNFKKKNRSFLDFNISE